jgi:hypothetical protein
MVRLVSAAPGLSIAIRALSRALTVLATAVLLGSITHNEVAACFPHRSKSGPSPSRFSCR